MSRLIKRNHCKLVKISLAPCQFFQRHKVMLNFQSLLDYFKNILNENSKSTQVFFAYAKTKTKISFAAKLISACVFATQKVQFLYFLNPEFQVSNHLLWLYRLVCVGPGRKPQRPVFSERGSNNDCLSICANFSRSTQCFADFTIGMIGNETGIY